MTATVIVIAALLVTVTCVGLWWDSRYHLGWRRQRNQIKNRRAREQHIRDIQQQQRDRAAAAHQINLQREKEKWHGTDANNN